MCEEESAGRKAAGSSCVTALLLEEQHYSTWAGMGSSMWEVPGAFNL